MACRQRDDLIAMDQVRDIRQSPISPPFGVRAKASTAGSSSAAERAAIVIGVMAKEGAAASTGRWNRSAYGAVSGL